MLTDLKSQVKRKKRRRRSEMKFFIRRTGNKFLSVVKHTLTKYFHNSKNEIEEKKK